MKRFVKICCQLALFQKVALKFILGTCAVVLFTMSASAQLSGTYTVCPSGCNFSTIQAAADALKSQGISSSVIISIQPGIYNEQVTVGTISGVSSAKTVTFKGAGSKNTDVQVRYKYGTCWTIKEVEYITVENLQIEIQFWNQSTYAISIRSSSHINVVDCKLYAVVLNTYNFPYAPVNLNGSAYVRIKGCHIRGGGTSMDTYGPSAGNTNVTIEGNLITKFYHYGLYMAENTNTSYLNNTIDSTTNPYNSGAINCSMDSGTVIVKGNKILSRSMTPIVVCNVREGADCFIDSNFVADGTYGITICSGTASKFHLTRNRIRNQTFYSARLYVTGDVDFSNNMIDIPAKANYGIYAYTYTQDANLKIQHNTVYMASQSVYGITLENKGEAKNISIKNNLFAGGAGIYSLGGLNKDNKIDGNNGIKTSGKLAVINGADYTSLYALKYALDTLTGTGNSEQNVSVTFVNAPDDLHLDHDAQAPYGVNAGVLVDFDGDRRCELFPTVGADETRVRNTPYLYLVGEDTVYSEVFDTLAPDSAYALDCGGPVPVTRTSNVNTSVLGTYYILYSAKDSMGTKATRKRVVIIEDKTAPVLALYGDSVMTVEVGSLFNDPGVNFSDNYYPEAALSPLLNVKSNVDMTRVGVYTIEYSLTDSSGNGPVTVKRTVRVVDTQPPLLSLIGDSIYVMDVNTTFNDPGIIIIDNYDKNLMSWDTTGTFYQEFPNGYADKLGQYSINYTVKDSSGNIATVKRIVLVQDTIAPRLSLIGPDTVIVCRWDTYIDSGADIVENYSRPSEMTVVEEGDFLTHRTQIAGIFHLRYKAADKAGNTGHSAWRTIIVLEPNTNGQCVTGIKEKGSLGKHLTLYPNPTSGRVTVSLGLPTAEQVKITVTNSLGQQVAGVDEGLLNAGTYTIDLSAQSSGVYLVTIQTATLSATKKLILAR